jgi:hypothetical protein
MELLSLAPDLLAISLKTSIQVMAGGGALRQVT